MMFVTGALGELETLRRGCLTRAIAVVKYSYTRTMEIMHSGGGGNK